MCLNFIKNYLFSFKRIIKPLSMVKGSTITIINTNKIENSNDFHIMPDLLNNRYDAFLVCPKCKEMIPVTSNHTKIIDKAGKITLEPSVLCEDCFAHFFVRKNIIYFV